MFAYFVVSIRVSAKTTRQSFVTWTTSLVMNQLPKPIGRLNFLGRYILAAVTIFALEIIFEWAFYFCVKSGKENLAAIFSFGAVFVVIILFWFLCFIRFIIIARLVSIGLNRWYALLLLLPFANFVFLLFLLFCPADKFAQLQRVQTESNSANNSPSPC